MIGKDGPRPFIGTRPPSADRQKLPLPMLCGLHDPLRSPVVDPRCPGRCVDRRAVTAGRQDCKHRLDGLCRRAGDDQVRRNLCIDLCHLGLR